MRNEQLKHYRDWDRDGAIRMENEQTLKLYHQLNEEAYHVNLADFECFSAYDRKQLDDGLKRISKTIDQVYKYGGGLFGTHDGFTRCLDYLEKKNERIKNECDPQEVYFDEFNNHECMFNYDGDTPAIDIIIEIFGVDVAKTIKRYNTLYTFEQLAKREDWEHVAGLTYNGGQTPDHVWFSNVDGKAYTSADCTLYPVYLCDKQYQSDSKIKWGMTALYKNSRLYKWHKE